MSPEQWAALSPEQQSIARTCPKCGAAGEMDEKWFQCPACSASWHWKSGLSRATPMEWATITPEQWEVARTCPKCGAAGRLRFRSRRRGKPRPHYKCPACGKQWQIRHGLGRADIDPYLSMSPTPLARHVLGEELWATVRTCQECGAIGRLLGLNPLRFRCRACGNHWRGDRLDPAVGHITQYDVTAGISDEL